MSIDYNDMFVLDDPFSNRYMRLTIIDSRFEEGAFKDFAQALFRGECNAVPPLFLQHKMGGQPADVIWSDYLSIIVISQRLKDLLSSENFTGWKTYDVNILDKKGKPLTGYYGLAITGRCGEQDYKRGIVIDKLPIVQGGEPYQVLRGFYFKDDYWDGSDFNLPGAIRTIIVTRRVVNAFKKAKIKNVKFIALPEYEIDLVDLKIGGEWPPK